MSPKRKTKRPAQCNCEQKRRDEWNAGWAAGHKAGRNWLANSLKRLLGLGEFTEVEKEPMR